MSSVADLITPALVFDSGALERNLARMASALPGARLRPHVKAHKCTALAHRQLAHGHRSFTCATVREVRGMAQAGLGDDLLLANEALNLQGIGGLDARITVAVDSIETIAAAAAGGIREVLIDVNVGLPRCGCAPEAAGALADAARRAGLNVRGVMGYEGHVLLQTDRQAVASECEKSMVKLLRAHGDVGGDLISAGATATFDLNTWATEIQAGSYALMDTDYGSRGVGFEQAAWIVATVLSVSAGYAVADCGLKSLGMDHGNPTIEGAQVLFCSDEHTTFVPQSPLAVGATIRVQPAHIDPTIAYHERAMLLDGDAVIDSWPIDLRGW